MKPLNNFQDLPMTQEPPSRLGATQPWKEQQSNINVYLSSRRQLSATIPRLLLAQFTDDTITVYQAYKESIADAAVRNGNFAGSEFSFSRMTWVKPNFSWMMHRSGWATKPDQERILRIRLRREYFDDLLRQAATTSWEDSSFDSVKDWSHALRKSDVLVQWDPDHHILYGARLPYRILQLGIRRRALDGFLGQGISSITDITEDVRFLRAEILSRPLSDPKSCTDETPLEIRYPLSESVGLGASEMSK